MSKYIIDETTLINIADAIRDKTLEKELLIDETNNLNSLGEDGIYANTTLLYPGTKYLVTYNNQKYVCESYISYLGAYCIGNEVIWTERYDMPSGDSEFHYENVPFFIVSEMNGNGEMIPGLLVEWSEWYIETEIEGDEYTVKIEKLLSDYNTISVNDYADTIRNMSVGKTTKTINIDWSSDYEQTAQLSYYDENFVLQTAYAGNFDIIEAQGGIIIVRPDHIDYMTDNFVHIPDYDVYIATADNATIGLYSSEDQ